MSKALVVVFHLNAGLTTGHYKVLFEYFKKELDMWADEIDSLYFVNSNGVFATEFDKYPFKSTIVYTHNLSHAQNLNGVFPLIKEDKICIIDADTLIYKKGELTKYFNLLDEHDVVSYIERPDEKEIARFAPYFFFGRRDIFPPNPDFSEAPPEHLDPMAKLTHELLKKPLDYFEIFDDRSTIQLTKTGIIRTPNHPTGKYHIRNFMGGVILVDSYKYDLDDFHRRFDAMPFEEVTRLLGWSWLLNRKTENDAIFYNDIYKILDNEMGVHIDTWTDYMKQFEEYHGYL